MTGQPAVNVGDYVVARHKKYADEMRSEVLGFGGAALDLVCVRFGEGGLYLDPDYWSFGLAERPQPPLADGVYQKEGAIQIRRGGDWISPHWLPGLCPSGLPGRDVDHADWTYIGPEASA